MWEDDWFWSYYAEEDELEEYQSQCAFMDDLYKAALIVLSLYVKNINEEKLADREGFWEQLDRLVLMLGNYIGGRVEETMPLRPLFFLHFCGGQGLKQWQIWMMLFSGERRTFCTDLLG